MRRDLIIGLIVSLAIHGGVAWIGQLTKHGPPKHKAVTEEKIIQIEMPKLEPDEPEKVETDEPVQPLDIAPPMQQDVPQLVQMDSFVQPIQPPPPEGLKPTPGMMVIPQGNHIGKGIEVFDISKLDKIPTAKFQTPPQYPFELRRAGVTGEVVVEFIVDTSGNVKDPYVVSSTQREFEAPALAAVSKWRFNIGKIGGRPVPFRMRETFGFTLNDN